MPWVPLDTHYLDDPKVQAAGELTPFALSALPALLVQAKLRSDGGRVELTYRNLAHLIFVSPDEASKAVRALVSAGVLTLESQDDRSAKVKFPSWRRWNENFRKAQNREGKRDEQAK